MHHGNYSSAPYYQYPHQTQNPNPTPNPSPVMDHSNASAPPYSSGYGPSDYSGYSAPYAPPYSQSTDPAPAPPAAPSYGAPATNPNLQSFNSIAPATNSNLQSFNSASPATSFPPFESHASYQSQTPPPPPTHPHQQSYFPSYDQHQTNPNYVAPPNPIPSPTSTPNSAFSASYGAPPAPVPPLYDNSYENYSKYDQAGAFFDDRLGGFNQNRSERGSNLYGKQQYDDGGYSDGVYAYQGGKSEPYGARGTVPNSSSSTLFDDYGRSINPSAGKSSASIASSKIVRAVPKADSQQDSKGGVQKFRVKVLAESGGQSTMDVLCQIGLDGIRMLDPSTSRTLRIYPLENITRCEKMDSSTLAVWSKSSADIEPRRVRLQSNSYTTNTLLDTVTAATVQLKEMGGSTRRSDSFKASEPPVERKKGIADWMNIIKPPNEEKDHWVPDEAVTKCTGCGSDFGAFLRKHHCRNCGDIFCDKCTNGRIALTAEDSQPVRVCDRCMAEVTQRLSNAKEGANKPAGLQSHEDLARKLQEEMEKNRKSSTGSKSEGSGRRMREVACPICTVHLQVQVPSSGSETIECGVCQSPFLVSAH